MAAIPMRLAANAYQITAAAISLVAIAAFADTPSGAALNGVFDPELAEIKPDAIGKLKDAIKKAPRECYPPRVKFTVVTRNVGDPLFVTTLGNARVEALRNKDNGLPSFGLEPDQFKVDSVKGVVDGVLVSYDKFNEDDKDPPTLKVTWVPKKGTKVKAGDKIKATIKASERYEDGHKSWPTGVYDIRLAAVGSGSEATVDFMDYGRPTQQCERRSFEATFTVPRNPLPIVHLKAIAEDGVGHWASEDGKFPTVEVWHGTDENFYDETSNEGVRTTYHGVVTFDLYETSKDKLEGQSHATWTSSQETLTGQCAGHKLTQDPKTVAWDAQLTGTIQRLPGSTRFEFQATPDRGPPYKVIESPGGACKLGSTYQWNNNEWRGSNFSLKPGQDHYDFFNAPPLIAGFTGQQYFKLHVESSGK